MKKKLTHCKGLHIRRLLQWGTKCINVQNNIFNLSFALQDREVQGTDIVMIASAGEILKIILYFLDASVEKHSNFFFLCHFYC